MQIQSSVQQQTKVKVCDVLTLRTDEQNTHTFSCMYVQHSAVRRCPVVIAQHTTRPMAHPRTCSTGRGTARGLHVPLSPLSPPPSPAINVSRRASV